MPMWKRNLIVCWFGMFATGVGMSQIAPVLPLYIDYLGIHDMALIEQFSGIAFGITFIVSAIFSPVWGQAADKFGRKPMLLRASLGMAIVIFSMGFAQNVYQLIGLRSLQGVITGYGTACLTLIATQTDKQHAGWAIGTLSTAPCRFFAWTDSWWLYSREFWSAKCIFYNRCTDVDRIYYNRFVCKGIFYSAR